MFKKTIDWLNWNVRIAFIDKVWTPLFPPDETPRLILTAEELHNHKKRFGMGSRQMAKMLDVTVAKFREWEEKGIYGPGDDGPPAMMIKVIAKILDDRKECDELLDSIGYTGSRGKNY